MAINHIVFSPEDNVAVLLESGKSGDILEIGGENITLASDVLQGFKVALRDIEEGAEILKYGESLGVATKRILPGEIVHSHNLKSGLSGELQIPRWTKPSDPEPMLKELDKGSFWGYRRPNGRVGIRNELWVIPTVGCVNGLIRGIVQSYPKPDWISAVRVLEHPWGCSQLGGDLDNTRKVLIGLAHNPNAAGVLVVALGCENLQLDTIVPLLEDVPNKATISMQQEKDEKEAIWGLLDVLSERAERDRVPCPLSDLVVAMKCGGSDGFSSITANPLLGHITDRITASGGTVMVGEIPEMFGAEKGLFARCASEEVHKKLADVLISFRDYFIGHGQPVFENPSPGNKAGGISTLEEKSLGAVSKSGKSIVIDVLDYGEVFTRAGLNVVYSPGNDLVSSTAMAAAGAGMVLFSTGRGTPFGTVVPTLKISTNEDLAIKKRNWIDFDASPVLTDGIGDTAQRLMRLVIEIAEGRETCNEKNNIGEISIFKSGVIL
nr:altronate dehydratase family protein [uncultured Dethiosulfovibrio sp.]